MKTFLRFILNRWVLTALGLLGLVLLIWFVGPLVAVGSWRPLASLWVRLGLTVLIAVLYFGALILTLTRARRASAELQKGMLEGESAGGNSQSGEPLKRRFADAIATLRQVRQDEAGHGWFARMLSALDRDTYLYRLPWYVIVGAPGTGKSTIFRNSGLKFPLGDPKNDEAVDGVGGTRNCKWLFSDKAVLLDTAGRYTTHESDRHADAAEWEEFLQLLKKTRPRQPINGIMVSVSADTLLGGRKSELEIQANAIRNRVHEIRHVLGLEVPVYLVVTKADLISGFCEFFDTLSTEEREQVWGVTLPLPASPKENVALTTIKGELEQLNHRLQGLLLGKLQRETDVERRTLLGFFPQSFHALQQPLLDFIETTFSANPYQSRILLRGFYFTSGAQQGAPVDPLLPAVAGPLGLRHSFSLARSAQMVFRPFFVARVFRELMLGEAHLAGSNLSWTRKRTLLNSAGYILLGVLVVLAAGSMLAGYQHNNDYVDAVAARVPKVREQVERINVGQDMSLPDLLPTLQAVRDIPAPAAGKSAPWLGNMGMYQGDKLSSAANNAYYRLLQDTFVPQINARLEQALRTLKNDPDLQYETLKVYLMLHDVEHFDANALKAWVMLDWDSNLPRDFPIDQRKQLETHLDVLLSRGAVQSLIPLDKDLTQQVRSLLSSAPLPNRIYGRLKRMGVGSQIAEFRITEAAGPSAAVVFVRASGAPLSQGMPGLFTADGYTKAFLPAIDPVLKDLFKEEGWVLRDEQGNKGLKDVVNAEQEQKKVRDAVRRLYLEEYAGLWQRFVSDIRIVPQANLEQSVHVTRVLSGPDSPLLYLLRGITNETSLVARAEGPTLGAKLDAVAASAVQAQKDKLQQLMTSKPTTRAVEGETRLEYIVDSRFTSIHRMVTPPGPNAPAPIDGTIVLLSDLYNYLTAADAAVQSKGALPASDLPQRLKSEAARMPEPIGGMLQGLGDTSVNHVQGVAKQNLSSVMENTVGEACAQVVKDRYPFNRASSSDVRRDDFARIFSPGGVIDAFFQKSLAQEVDTSTKPWSFKPGTAGAANNQSVALADFQRAAVIRDVFFPGGNQAQVRFTIKPVEMDAALAQTVLDIDGQVLKYRHGAIVPQQMTWPGSKGTGQIRLAMNAVNGSDVGGLTFEGDWALWHAMDKAVIEQTARPETVRVVFKIQDRYVKYEITTSTVQSPFRLAELDKFKCPTAL
ncbi:type VI secretion system protein ImpL [Andreprevotia lacus DSM 23236]|jgi:type VI secretion system protein ImpL|uniref:Type VI secretion system protein ImpL n=1 Tax=Andreprevotia lacus DSM 23236 TaxID=1121001 RepID=A0A1W1XNC7_9NEIS|nr:type VI secretion system membrane subunit TssM [Andreprevotia lacus]SMC25011.1 type VI secretion system protein ImpL [Andreprevotia lacus DSM 23236]